MGGSQSANATGAASTPVANSQFGGLLGSASNAIGRSGDTMQNLFSGKLGTGAQPRPDYNPQKQQQNQMGDAIKDAFGKVGQAAASPYDRAAKSQSDSASAWSAMQRGSGDGSGSLGFSSMGGYDVPEAGDEKVSQGWADAFKSIGTAAMGAMGSAGGGAGGFGSQAEMLKHTAPGTTGSFNAGMGWVPRATRA
jgi:hypothetical protein